MANETLIWGLKKAAVVLHAVAMKMQQIETVKETLSLVSCISEAVKILEAPQIKETPMEALAKRYQERFEKMDELDREELKIALDSFFPEEDQSA